MTRLIILILAFIAATASLADEFTERPWGSGTAAEDCVVCHSLEEGGEFRVAPNLWGIVGDAKARDRSWYSYSPGLIRMGGTWTEEDLDGFLTDAQEFSPGSTKSIRIDDPQKRAEIIKFLADLRN